MSDFNTFFVFFWVVLTISSAILVFMIQRRYYKQKIIKLKAKHKKRNQALFTQDELNEAVKIGISNHIKMQPRRVLFEVCLN